MALITISGYPASGKSRRAHQLQTYLENQLQDPSYQGPALNVKVISDDNLNIKRRVYDGLSVSTDILSHGNLISFYTTDRWSR